MDALAYACGIIGAGSLLFWRHWGLAVVGIVAVTTAVYSAREYAGGPALLPGPLALLALGYTAPRRVGWIGAAGYVAVAVVVRLAVGDADLGPLLIIAGWAFAAVLAGQAIAARAERAAAERERVVHAQEQALANERLRIAQDLHDSVAHAMATINVQSGVAAHLLDGDTGQAKQALEAIRAASSDALDELTAILSVLRASGGRRPARRCPTCADRNARRHRRARDPCAGGWPGDRRRRQRRRWDAATVGQRRRLPRRAGSADEHSSPCRCVGSRRGRRRRRFARRRDDSSERRRRRYTATRSTAAGHGWWRFRADRHARARRVDGRVARRQGATWRRLRGPRRVG